VASSVSLTVLPTPIDVGFFVLISTKKKNQTYHNDLRSKK
jgi:hypothetical protein